jgi:hypothetical protein
MGGEVSSRKAFSAKFAITEFSEVRSQKAGAYDKPCLESANLPHQNSTSAKLAAINTSAHAS